MSVVIRGIGWVTPLGNGLDEVWQRLAAGDVAQIGQLASPHPSPGDRSHYYVPVPPKQVEFLARTPRIRRSSSITYFTTAAGLAAMADAGLPVTAPMGMEPIAATRTAVIFAVCSGGVNYTRRFYEKVVADGPASASPLLFPETVYNAPASHLAALLGIDGASYTLVGDATVGLSALNFADELLATDPEIDQCVVVGGEECDWILCEGYASWRLLSCNPELRVNSGGAPNGMIMAEGAAAIVVGRSGDADNDPGAIHLTAATVSFSQRAKAATALESAINQLSTDGTGLVVGSANGTWIDGVESTSINRHFADRPVYYPKAAFGEALGASSLIQVALAALALRRDEIPDSTTNSSENELSKATVTAVGLNQQAAAAVLWKTVK